MAANGPRRLANWQYLLYGPSRSPANISKQATILQIIQNHEFSSGSSLEQLIDAVRKPLQELYDVQLFELLYFRNDHLVARNADVITQPLLLRITEALPIQNHLVAISDDINIGIIPIHSVNVYAIVCSRDHHEADDLHAFLHFMFDQIRHDVNAANEQEVLSIKSTLADGLFHHGTNNKAFLKRMILQFNNYIPDFPHFRKPSEIITQLLITDPDNDAHFTIAASSTGDGENRTIKYEDSLVGIAAGARDRLSQYETSKYPGHYKSFTTRNVRRELISKIIYGERLLGLLNIETSIDEPFCKQYLLFVERYCSSIAPFVAGSINQSNEERKRTLSLMYVFSSMSRDVSATFAHSIEQPLFRLINSAHNIESLVRSDNINIDPSNISTIRRTTNIIEKSVATIREEASDLMVQLPTNVQIGAIPVRSIIKNRIDKIKDGLLNEDIDITIPPGADYDVYASSLLSRHIFDLIDNSIDSIREAMASGMRRRGKITVSFERKPDIDSKGSRTGLSVISVIVRDNGLGASNAWLTEMGEHTKTTKQGGHGFGVFAARAYCQFFNGSLNWKNLKRNGKITGFQMTARFIQFDPSIHPNGDVMDFLAKNRTEI